MTVNEENSELSHGNCRPRFVSLAVVDMLCLEEFFDFMWCLAIFGLTLLFKSLENFV